MPQRFIFTKQALAALAANRKLPEAERRPVVKVFNPYGAATWLLSEIDADGDTLFGLCDLGMGCPELGNVSRAELESIRIERGGCKLPLERDAYFTAKYPLWVYTKAANAAGRIVESKLREAFESGND